MVITLPEGTKTTLSFNLDFECNNNQAEYEALIIGLQILQDLGAKEILKRNHPSILERGIQVETLNIDMNLAWDWHTNIKTYLEIPAKKVPFKVRAQALNYVLLEGYLFRRTLDGLLFRCVDFS